MNVILNCKPTPRSNKDFLATPVDSVSHLPLEVDMEAMFPPIFNQLGLGACTANAAAALRDFLQIYRAQVYIPTSRLYIYWHARDFEGTVGEDAGALTRDVLAVLYSDGVCEESLFSYNILTFNDKPSAEAEANAPKYKITEYHRMFFSNQAMQSLAEWKPVLAGIAIFESFWKIDSNGIMVIPDTQVERNYGGHCVVLIGYKYINGELYFKVRNSWGPEWGDRGHFWMPATYVDSEWVFDLWTGTINTTYETIAYEEAIHILCDNEHIYTSPSFWLNLGIKYANDTTSDFRYLQLLFRKFAAYAQNLPPVVGTLNTDGITFQDAVTILSTKLVMASPDFWTNLWAKYSNDVNSDFRFLGLAIIKFAARIKAQ